MQCGLLHRVRDFSDISEGKIEKLNHCFAVCRRVRGSLRIAAPTNECWWEFVVKAKEVSMITISVCMIVKNEELTLSRCLECLKKIADEIIIVDTGSTDDTKEIAAKYTDQIYDFEWVDDFSAARNFAFSKATMEYIYSADADEIIDLKNQQKLMELKQCLLPQIDIVQMYYTNQLEYGTTYNYDKEYRPKLFKRVRTFFWSEPIHERVNIEPVIYDSEIEIIHKPHEYHGKRDFLIFQKLQQEGKELSAHLFSMYARELWIVGDQEDFLLAEPTFSTQVEIQKNQKTLVEGYCVLARIYRLKGQERDFFRCCTRFIGDSAASELCFELGEFYLGAYEEASMQKALEQAAAYLEEAVLWFYHAAFEAEPALNLDYGRKYPIEKLIVCERLRGNEKEAKKYEGMIWI